MTGIFRRSSLVALLFVLGLFAGAAAAADTVPTDIQQAGTQPGEGRNLESPDKCDNCHGGYDRAVEPAFAWRGSAMGNAGRDPIFWATMAIAEQDFDGSGDLCIRCHSTGGWYGGRSLPTDGSGLAASDSDGVDCDSCHAMTNPDDSEIIGEQYPPFVANDGVEGFYGSGMLSLFGGRDKLGPYLDADAKHQFLQSKFHRSVDFCGSCHDVSNPAVGDLAPGNGAQPTADAVTATGTVGGDVGEKAAFNNPPYMYGVVERTFSEYKASALPTTRVEAFDTLPEDLRVPGGALETAYQAALAAGTGGNYEDGDTRYFSCQTCHMKPVSGYGANKRGIPYRNDLPHHDLTGGNSWIGDLIKYQDSRGLLRLGGDLSADQVAAIEAGQQRALQALREAASLTVTDNTVKVTNLTGHKLISGYPEGRRMWLQITWYDDAGTEIRVDGAYGPIGITVPNPSGGPDVAVESIIDLHDPNTKIYEAHYGITQAWAQKLIDVSATYADLVVGYDRLTGEPEATLSDVANQSPGTSHESFHFVLNDTVIKDNRIPPFGMDYEKARRRNALPVPASQYGSPSGAGETYDYYDQFTLIPPAGATSATVELLYQGTSWEYIQFLNNANNRANAFLGDEGENLLDAWLNTGMAEPVVMASATWGSGPPPGDEPPPADSALIGVTALQTGVYTGKGNNATFSGGTTFSAGDDVIILAEVSDDEGFAVEGATVEMAITGPESATLSGTSDGAGVAELSWSTKAPKRNGSGGTPPGSYTATTTNVTLSGYEWDGVQTDITFELQ